MTDLSAVSKGRAVRGYGVSTVLIHLAGAELLGEIRPVKKSCFDADIQNFKGPAARRGVGGPDVIWVGWGQLDRNRGHVGDGGSHHHHKECHHPNRHHRGVCRKCVRLEALVKSEWWGPVIPIDLCTHTGIWAL